MNKWLDKSINGISIQVYFLGIYILLLLFDITSFKGFGSIPKVWACILVAMYLLSYHRVRVDWSVILILFSLLLVVISLSYSVSFEDTFTSVKRLTLNYLLVIIISNMRSYNKKEISFLIFCSVILGILIIAVTLIGGHYEGSRVTLYIKNARQDQNYLVGTIYYLVSACGYYLCFSDNKKIKKLALIIAILSLVFTILTGSRGGLIAVCAIFLIYLIEYYKKSANKKQILGKTITIGILIWLYSILAMRVLPSEFTSRFTISNIISTSGAGRFIIWKEELRAFKEGGIFVWLFGYGMQTTAIFNERLILAHNSYLEYLVGEGLVGFSLFIAIIIDYFRRAVNSKNIYMSAVLVAYIIQMMSVSILYLKALFFSMMIISIMAYNEYDKEHLIDFFSIQKSEKYSTPERQGEFE
jgi:O-antigen ligase